MGVETHELKSASSEVIFTPFSNEAIPLHRFIMQIEQGAYATVGKGMSPTNLRPALVGIIEKSRHLLPDSGIKPDGTKRPGKKQGFLYGPLSQRVLLKGLAELNKAGELFKSRKDLEQAFRDYCEKCGY
ncbi:hypothetical protein A2841_02965 [Candidatus Kaiserbacteria bacterium RIFCSPHIGHO2_01_FULL_48_10]|uniref:Uncharacterized protein n=1 Tax=Candidatus Kaiserbacteria bacterium RIFCSPHIGHO2_01_FULL_48_10 TaxID=1798476 RepID=A0A1F6C124_9BACT|nr:MAG: hypothetical protein A2841_02965 [Candidatus Kaiserbacteria bacterium RIFCSPHIGHO2_01_FULL_48_10]